MSVKVGLVGLGHMGSLHLMSCLKMRHFVEVVAVADKIASNREKASKLGVKVYDDYEMLLDNEQLDCLIVSVPNYLKEECVKYAAEKNVDVFLDKPLARTLEEAIRIKAMVESKGIQLMVGANYRYFPSVKKLKDLFDEGRIGDVHLASYELVMNGPFSHPLVPRPVAQWWFDPSKSGGGALIDLGYHLIDLNIWFFGKCEVLASNLQHIYHLPVEDAATVVIRSKDSGLVSVLNTGWFSKMVFPDFNFRVNLHGSTGFLTTDKFVPKNMVVNAAKEGSKNMIYKILGKELKYLSYTYYYASFFESLKDFFTAIKKGVDVPVSIDHELETMRIIDSVYSQTSRST